MDINKLEKGMVLKSYRHLCEVLGTKPVDGNTKVALFKDLDCLLSYHKEGNKIIIDEIYDEARVRENKTKKSIYYDHCLITLCYMLQKRSNNPDSQNSLIVSKSSLAKTMGFINSCYYINKNNEEFILKNFNDKNALKRDQRIYRNAVKDFYKRTRACFSSTVTGTLDRLEKEKIIKCRTMEQAVYFDKDDTESILQEIENGNIDSNEKLLKFIKPFKRNYCIAESYDNKNLLFIENTLLQMYGVKTERDIYKMKKSNEYYFNVSRILLKEYGLYEINTVYEIVSLEDKIDKIIKSHESLDNYIQLNEKFYNKMIDNSKKREEKQLKEAYEKNKTTYKTNSEDIKKAIEHFCKLCECNLKLKNDEQDIEFYNKTISKINFISDLYSKNYNKKTLIELNIFANNVNLNKPLGEEDEDFIEVPPNFNRKTRLSKKDISIVKSKSTIKKEKLEQEEIELDLDYKNDDIEEWEDDEDWD